MIARGIRRRAARFTRARCGICRTRPNEKLGKLSSWNLGPLANYCLSAKDSNLKHRETLSQRLPAAASLIANAAFSLPFTSSA